jgi:alkylated DNA repair dioxygenase AlkB
MDCKSNWEKNKICAPPGCKHVKTEKHEYCRKSKNVKQNKSKKKSSSSISPFKKKKKVLPSSSISPFKKKIVLSSSNKSSEKKKEIIIIKKKKKNIIFINNLIKTEKSFLSVYDIKNKKLFVSCVTDISNKLIKNPTIQVYGRKAIQHRSIGFFSNDSIGYYYSGQLAKSQELTPNLLSLLNQINNFFCSDYNGILVNKYESGEDYISAHSDDEKNLSDAGVLSISYGGVRKFRIRDKKTKQILLDIPTEPFLIIQMGGHFQKEFLHEIPIQKNIKEERISFTFRKHTK